MIQALKKRSLQKFYDKNIRKKVNPLQIRSKIISVAVLCSSDECIKVQSELQKILGVNASNITCLQFTSIPKKEEDNTNNFSPKDFGFRGKIASDTLQKFINTEFDLLVNCTTEANLYTNIVTLQSKAIFKVGYSGVDDNLFDLVISEPNFDSAIFYQELEKYLRILKKI